MTKQVAILMSTYNGEKYLAEQIESIINQSYSNWHLYIRDDGSTDNTVKIIKKYSSQNSKITFYNENNIKNIGVTNSFVELLMGTSADFYMFSDQDDFWKSEKVNVTVKAMLNNSAYDKPICVFSELEVVDKDLNPLRRMNGHNVWLDFPHFLFGNCVTGCTMMINQRLKDTLRLEQTDFNKVYLHDWWIALFASAFGKLIYLNQPTILYRQHGNNVEGSKKDNIFTLIRRSINMRHELTGLIKIFTMDKEFWRLFSSQLHGTNYQYLSNYIHALSVGSFKRNLRLLFNYPPKRAHLKGNILFSYLILTRKNTIRKKLLK